MRKGVVKPRKRFPDPKFQNERVTRFVNDLMLNGKKILPLRYFMMPWIL
jgi:ribosomal protein S7